MKKRHSLSVRQLFLACCLFAFLTGFIILLFAYHRDEKQFSNISKQLFYSEMTASTLNMHYTLANPANFGISHYDAVLPIYSAEGQLANQTSLENTLSALQTINLQKLSEQDSYTCTLLIRSLDNSLKLNSYEYYQEPLSPSSGMQSQLPILLAEYTFRTEQDIKDYLALLDQTDSYFASLLTYEQEKADAGLLMAASSLQKVKEQCDTIITKEDLEAGTHFLQTTFEERLEALYQSGEITIENKEKYIAQNDRLLSTVLLPAYEALADGLFLLEDSSIPLSGLAAKPEGSAYYQYLLISETGSYREISDICNLLAEQFHSEYQAIHSIVSKYPQMISTFFEDNYQDFPYQEASAILTNLQQQMAEDFPSLNTESSSFPEVTVKTVSKSLEDYCAPAFYLTAPLDDTNNNVIYINEKNSPTGLELYTTLAHEGYPGHLYQTVYSNRSFLENEENEIRQILWYGGYQEGWALYVEFLSFDYASQLMEDLGKSNQAVSIQLEKHNRSLQLCLYSLLDIMIHYENASYSQVAKVLQNFGIEDTASVNSIYTYIAEEPCNYLKYYLGYLEILELQKLAKTKWQDAYSDYAFHTFYLDCGPSDFTTLQERLEKTDAPQ